MGESTLGVKELSDKVKSAVYHMTHPDPGTVKEELEGATSEVDEPFGEASYDVKPSDEWLRRMADAEDKAGSISVGGLAFSAGELVESPEPPEPEETHES